MDRNTILDRAKGLYASDSYIDVIKLARSFDVDIVPNDSVQNARIVYKDAGGFLIEINPQHPETRQRFSIAHELAHLILHKEDIIRVGIVDRDSENSLNKEKEEDANNLASEILMPSEIVKEFVKDTGLDDNKPLDEIAVRKVASFFNVSALVALLKLRELNYYVPYIPFA